jgi:hypothetical protein
MADLPLAMNAVALCRMWEISECEATKAFRRDFLVPIAMSTQPERFKLNFAYLRRV